MRYTIENELLTVEIEEFGAELVSVKRGGTERIWQNPTGEWAGHAPLLFPVCGHCGIRVNGVDYPVKLHGFARKSAFTLKEKTATCASFTLSANEETKKVYPYDFIFTVTYRLDGARLTVVYDVENPADTALYFGCGAHDAFAIDKNVGAYEFVFDRETELVHYFHNDDGYLTGETKDYGKSDVLPLPEDFLQEGRTLIFKKVTASEVTLRERGGKALAKVGFGGFDNLLVWREGDAAFLCIEPWTNMPDFADRPDVEFSTKEGIEQVAPKGKKTTSRYIEFL